MTRHVDKISERYNKPSSEFGCIGECLYLDTDSDETVLIHTSHAFDSSVKSETGQFHAFAVIITLLKSFFKKGFDLVRLVSDPRFKIYTVVEVPKEYIEDYIVAGVEGKDHGVYFHLSSEETTGLQQYVPVIND